jgi:ABC-type branched-subunit amino acid transport system ATPase component
MLKLNNIEVTYLNVVRVLHGVSLNVEEGLIVALLGANGAGKSTTLKAISGLLHIEEGEVTDGSIEWNENASIKEAPNRSANWALSRRSREACLRTPEYEENLMVVLTTARTGPVSNATSTWYMNISPD